MTILCWSHRSSPRHKGSCGKGERKEKVLPFLAAACTSVILRWNSWSLRPEHALHPNEAQKPQRLLLQSTKGDYLGDYSTKTCVSCLYFLLHTLEQNSMWLKRNLKGRCTELPLSPPNNQHQDNHMLYLDTLTGKEQLVNIAVGNWCYSATLSLSALTPPCTLNTKHEGTCATGTFHTHPFLCLHNSLAIAVRQRCCSGQSLCLNYLLSCSMRTKYVDNPLMFTST